MTVFQKVIKYSAMAFAILLTISIIGGLLSMFGLFGGFFGSDAVKLRGAGPAIESLIAASGIDIDGGAGKITIADGTLHDLDLDMGVGRLNLTSALTGNCTFDLGVGRSNITVIGNRENYKLDIEKGVGSITVDGTGVSNLKEQWNRENSLDIRGGVGSIDLKFKAAN